MRFVRENHQMSNETLYCEDVLQMLFADSDSEGEYLRFGNDDRPSNDRASPRTSLRGLYLIIIILYCSLRSTYKL